MTWRIDSTGIGQAFFFKQLVGLAMALNATDVLVRGGQHHETPTGQPKIPHKSK